MADGASGMSNSPIVSNHPGYTSAYNPQTGSTVLTGTGPNRVSGNEYNGTGKPTPFSLGQGFTRTIPSGNSYSVNPKPAKPGLLGRT
jgi:hypothetical protein